MRPRSLAATVLALLLAAGTGAPADATAAPADAAVSTSAATVPADAAASAPGGGARPAADAPRSADRDTLDFYRFGPYREGIPTPREFLGYRLGSRHTEQQDMRAYFRALEEAAPERIRVSTYGESYLGRPLILAAVGSPENVERREEIRENTRRLASPGETSAAEASEIASSSPIVVWLDYGNDGDETANMEAALQVAYQLVAGRSERTRRILENGLVVINPLHNPESRARFVEFYRNFGVGAPDPTALEHEAPWGMGSNNNRYQIDLNRDKWGMTQRETQEVVRAFLRWNPQVLVDHHGETEQYFFPPPTKPVNPVLPESHDRWYETFGRGNARAFDRHGWQYYTRDVFDLYYPGYWDTWPSLHGAIGMTYETDAGGSKGLRWERQDGTVVTFRDGIEKHFVASLATAATAAENREAILTDYAAFFRTGMEEGREGDPARAYLIPPGEDPRRAAVLASTLLRHGVELARATEAFRATAAEQVSGERVTRTFPAGTWVVDMAQADQRAAENFLALELPLDSAFVREQFARWARNARRGAGAGREYYEFYDVTAWSLPVAIGVEAFRATSLPGAETEPVTASEGEFAGTGYWSDELAVPSPVEGGVRTVLGGPAPVGEGDPPARSIPADSTARAGSAYLYEPVTEGSRRLTAKLMEAGHEVAVSTRPLMADGREFPRGTHVVRVGRNPAGVHRAVDSLAREAGVRVVGSHTAFPASGETGPGSGTVLGLTEPRVALVGGESVSSTSYGAAWFTLQRRLGQDFTPVRPEGLLDGDLGRFNVVVVPNGYGLADVLGESGVERLRGWIERGGTLVGWGGTASFAVRNDLTTAGMVEGGRDSAGAGGDRARELLSAIDSLPRTGEPLPPAVSPTAEPGALQPVPGANLRTELDLTHWLTIGLTDPTLPVIADGGGFLTLSEEGANPVVFPETGDLEVAGFTWPNNTDRLLRGTAWSVVEPVGEGQVVLFQTDPNYRLVWRSTSRLFANAVLLGPTFAGDGVSRY